MKVKYRIISIGLMSLGLKVEVQYILKLNVLEYYDIGGL